MEKLLLPWDTVLGGCFRDSVFVKTFLDFELNNVWFIFAFNYLEDFFFYYFILFFFYCSLLSFYVFEFFCFKIINNFSFFLLYFLNFIKYLSLEYFTFVFDYFMLNFI